MHFITKALLHLPFFLYFYPMKRKSTIIIMVFMLSLFLTKASYAQFSTLESFGAKSNSLANISTTFKDINANYTNQAGLAFLKGLEVDASYENRFLSLDLSAINFAIAKSFQKIGTFGFTIKKFGVSEFNEFLFGFAYARKLNNSTGIAIQLNAYNLNIKNYGSKSTISFETGILHDFTDNFSMGFHVSNPFPIRYIGESDIPTIISLGAKYNASDNIVLYGELEKHIEYGLFVKTAIEYKPLNIFSISLGYKNDLNGVADFSMGIMYAIKSNIYMNLGTVYNITLGLSPSIGLSYALNSNIMQ